ncbi:class I SAM-dependent methyltransferase [Neorhizobium sp. P12A]|jgi:ubiquinone/menaquinone biosynthesis C-methylase UbiE|uniref:class I SAM-dependent methyltransferase n=1 Tax=Rhizobium/Agrobacterium group TaxID=227290 RepID=UPI0010461D00|nr:MULTISPECIES: class I SAM-dependent methyltransferase [Rhizobium/Agrobacterium group]KAA0700670.1 class I SAM-dependent methyltransferase [Neorhizobium sp. P12A]TCR91928.1 methyltransferase family protein [Rhizobium sp. BK376]
MTAAEKAFAGPIPEIYDRLLVPLIFEPYARHLAERVEKLKPQSLLEVAAGTGAVTRALALRLDEKVRILASDLNQPMIDFARSRQGNNGRITWQQADALSLPFEAQSFDIVVCQFGAMFFPDKAKGYREAHRVLRPNGHYIFSVWDKLENNEFAQFVEDTLADHFPQDPPRFMGRTPHGYWAIDPIRNDLKASGFREVTVDTSEQKCRARSAHEVAIAYCQGTPLRVEIEARSPSGLDEATEVVAEALTRRFGTGSIDSRITAHVIEAVR